MIDIVGIKILEVEKRKEKLIGSYFIYEIEVDVGTSRQIVFRRYSELYDFHMEMLIVFPRFIVYLCF